MNIENLQRAEQLHKELDALPFSVDEIENYVMALKERIKVEYSECHDDEYEQECNWPPNPCKCKAGHSSKPIIKPPYWNRIRSFCVNNHH